VSVPLTAETFTRYHFKEPVPLRQVADSYLIKTNAGVDLVADRVGDSEYHLTSAPLALAAPVQMGRFAIPRMVTTTYVTPVFTDDQGLKYAPIPEVLVHFRADVTPDEAEFIIAQIGGLRVLESDWNDRQRQYRLTSLAGTGTEVLRQANQLALRDEVIYAEPNAVSELQKHQVFPNDPRFDEQWALWNTGQSGGQSGFDLAAPIAWQTTTGDASIITVVYDDGIQLDHPDINAIPGRTFNSGSSQDGEPHNSQDNHGTAVAGVIGAIFDNGLGIAGLAGDAVVASAKFSDSGEWFFLSDWVDSIEWAEDLGARVTNSSFGATQAASVSTAFANTKVAGVLHFASTGNSGSTGIGFPANDPSVAAVGSANRFGNRSSSSTYGPEIEFVAPGEQVLTLDRTGSRGYNSSFTNGDYATVSGTSFSSPYAAGVAALILSVSSELGPDDVLQLMRDTAEDMGASGYDNQTGYGMLDPAKALESTGPLPELVSLEFTPQPVREGDPAVGTITIDSVAPDRGATVRLTHNSSTSLTLPGAVTIPAGETSTTFEVITNEGSGSFYHEITAEIGNSSLTVTFDVVLRYDLRINVEVPDYDGDLAREVFIMEIYEQGTDNRLTRNSGRVNASGQLTSGLAFDGFYDLEISMDNSLVVRQTVEFNSLTQPFYSFVLGDANQDNQVGTGDFLKLVAAWKSKGGDANWDGSVDFNGDGVIGTADYLILVKNWGKSGD
jgi:subtilisin family serine protease